MRADTRPPGTSPATTAPAPPPPPARAPPPRRPPAGTAPATARAPKGAREDNAGTTLNQRDRPRTLQQPALRNSHSRTRPPPYDRTQTDVVRPHPDAPTHSPEEVP